MFLCFSARHPCPSNRRASRPALATLFPVIECSSNVEQDVTPVSGDGSYLHERSYEKTVNGPDEYPLKAQAHGSMHCAARESGRGLDRVRKKNIEDYRSLEARRGAKGLKEIKMSEYHQCECPHHDDGTASSAGGDCPNEERIKTALRLVNLPRICKLAQWYPAVTLPISFASPKIQAKYALTISISEM
jgi:hypothetical protein